MLTKYISSATAALLITGGVAFAQGTGEGNHANPSIGANSQQGSSSGAEQSRPNSANEQPEGTAKNSRSADEPAGTKHRERPSARDAAKPEQGKDSLQGAGNERGGAAKTADEPNKQRPNASRGDRTDAKHSDGDKSKKEGGRSAATGSADDHNKSTAEERDSNSERSEGAKPSGAKNVQIDSEKQARISEAIRNQHVENISKADFDVRVGGVVPGHHHLRALPEDIVSIVPEYRGYDFLVANDEVVIIEPRTHRIVYTLQEGRSAATNRKAVDCR